eukprot:2727916-Amphidinium_carterae.1
MESDFKRYLQPHMQPLEHFAPRKRGTIMVLNSSMRQRRNAEQTSTGCASIVTRSPRCKSGQRVAGQSRIGCEELKSAGWSKRYRPISRLVKKQLNAWRQSMILASSTMTMCGLVKGRVTASITMMRIGVASFMTEHLQSWLQCVQSLQMTRDKYATSRWFHGMCGAVVLRSLSICWCRQCMLRIVCVCKKWQGIFLRAVVSLLVTVTVTQCFLEQLLGAVWQWPCEVTWYHISLTQSHTPDPSERMVAITVRLSDNTTWHLHSYHMPHEGYTFEERAVAWQCLADKVSALPGKHLLGMDGNISPWYLQGSEVCSDCVAPDTRNDFEHLQTFLHGCNLHVLTSVRNSGVFTTYKAATGLTRQIDYIIGSNTCKSMVASSAVQSMFGSSDHDAVYTTLHLPTTTKIRSRQSHRGWKLLDVDACVARIHLQARSQSGLSVLGFVQDMAAEMVPPKRQLDPWQQQCKEIRTARARAAGVTSPDELPWVLRALWRLEWQ